MPFSYDGLPADLAETLRGRAGRIGRSETTLATIVANGEEFAAACGELRHKKGGFKEWVEALGWTRQLAYHCLWAWKAWVRAGKCKTVLHLPLTPLAVYRLTTPNAPSGAFGEAVERARAGEEITPALASDIVARHRQPTVQTVEAATGGDEPPDDAPLFHPPHRPFTYASLCSGIEGASVAWHDLGWRPLFFAEVNPYCSELLGQHYPDVANLGDIARIDQAAVEGANGGESSTCSLPARRASPSLSPGFAAVLRTIAESSPSSSFALLANWLHDGSSGRTCPVSCPPSGDEPLAPSSGGWMNAGMGMPGECWTLNTSECPRDAVESSLWDVLEPTGSVPSSLSLTPEQRRRIAERVERYGKTIPPEIAQLFTAGVETKPPSSAGE